MKNEEVCVHVLKWCGEWREVSFGIGENDTSTLQELERERRMPEDKLIKAKCCIRII